MRTNLRSKVTLLFMTFAVLLAMPTIAFADLVTVSDANTLQASGDATKQVGQTGSARFHLLVNDNATDPVNGCNANTSNKVKATVASTAKDKNGNNLATSPVTFDSPGYVELEACDNPDTTTTIEGAKTLGYTVSSSAQVGDVITVTANASGGRQGGTGTYSYDTFTITVVAPPEQGTALSVSPASGTYGGTATLSAKLTSGSSNTAVAGKQVAFKLNGSSVGSASTGTDGVATLSNVSLANIPAGEYVDAVSASYAGTGTSCTSNCYGPSSGTAALSVDKADLTVTTKDETKVYGDANPAFSVSYSGFKNDDTASSLGGTLGFDTTADAGSDVGSYDVTPKGLTSDNYNISFVAGKLSVTKAPLKIMANDASREYGEANPAFSGSIVSGLKNNDALSVSASTTATQSSDFGSYAIVPSLGGAKASNYDVTAQNGTLTITKASLTVQANDASRQYGDADPQFSATITGFKLSDTQQSVVTGSPAFSSNATQQSPVGTYAITPSAGSLAATNYRFATFQDGELTVTKAPLTIKANDASREYGDPNPALTGSIVSGLKNNDALSVSASTNATQASDVGSYAIIPSLSGAKASNYDVTAQNGTLRVTAAPITIKANDASREYGDANPAFSGTIVSGLKNNDALSVSASSLATVSSNVGTYAIVPSLSGAKASNYDVTPQNGTLTITKAPLSAKANNNSREYGEANPTFTGTLTGVKNNDPISASYSSAATPGSDVGSYAIVPQVNATAAVLSNYQQPNLTNGTLTVTRAPLAVNTDNKSREYGDPNPTFTGSIVGTKNGDPISASYSSEATQGTDFGTYAITAQLIDPQQKLGNYTVTNDGGTLTITRATLVIQANDASRFYGDPNPTFSGTIVSGLKNNDALTVSASSEATVSSPVGPYPIVPSVNGAKEHNYIVDARNGILTVGGWRTTGFYNPVDMLDSTGNYVINTVKGGSTVPMKFEVFKGATELKDVSAIKSTTYAKSSYCNGAYADEIEVVLTGNTSLRFDATSDQFIYNWKTPTGAGCYKSVMTTQDGSQLIAFFKTR